MAKQFGRTIEAQEQVWEYLDSLEQAMPHCVFTTDDVWRGTRCECSNVGIVLKIASDYNFIIKLNRGRYRFKRAGDYSSGTVL